MKLGYEHEEHLLNETPLEEFKRSNPEHWAQLGYDRLVIGRFFHKDILSALSLEEYIQLLKRFPSEMVTHVTRQGVRDHVGRNEHTVGRGEFHSGFTNMLADNKQLRSSIGRFVQGKPTQEAVFAYLSSVGQEQIQDYTQAVEIFERLCDTSSIWRTYVDHSAIHFAAEDVADIHYGAESGNEIFIAFPSAYIASQHYFHGNLNERSQSTTDNDIWVWPIGNGLSIDAGVVFIPAQAQVDRSTGSRYSQDHEGNPEVINANASGNLRFKLANDPTTSKDYWETYFQINPTQRPKRTVYYDGSPIDGLNNWRIASGLSKRLVQQLPPAKDLKEQLQRMKNHIGGSINTLPQYGFPEHELNWEALVSGQTPVTADLAAFREEGLKALYKYYAI